MLFTQEQRHDSAFKPIVNRFIWTPAAAGRRLKDTRLRLPPVVDGARRGGTPMLAPGGRNGSPGLSLPSHFRDLWTVTPLDGAERLAGGRPLRLAELADPSNASSSIPASRPAKRSSRALCGRHCIDSRSSPTPSSTAVKAPILPTASMASSIEPDQTNQAAVTRGAGGVEPTIGWLESGSSARRQAPSSPLRQHSSHNLC